MLLTTLFATLAMQAPAAPALPAAPGGVQGVPGFPTAPRGFQGAPGGFLRAEAGPKVSLNFTDAKVSDVLGFLKKQKISFVLDADQFKDRRLTLSIVDQPQSVALEAIASALDAHWENIGSVRVLKKGMGAMSFGGGFGGFQAPGGWAPDIKNFRNFQFSMPDMKEFKWDGKDFEKLREELKKQGIEMKTLGDLQRAKALDGNQALRDREVKKALDQARKQIDVSKKQIEEARSLAAKSGDLSKLMKSLTPEQKELHKKQGYLKLSDLTADQRKLTGATGEGKFDMSIVIDGETLKIKND